MAPELEKTVPYEEKVRDFSLQLDRLKNLFDQYFLGFERIAPLTLRQDVERRMLQLKGELVLVQNTALRFQVNSLQAKFNSLRQYWDRTMKQIEDGTHKRDQFRLKLHMQQKALESSSSASPPQENLPPTKPEPTQNKRLNSLETLLNQYITAKKKCKEPVKGITYEVFAKTISKQSNALRKRYQCKSIRFKVVIENGKTKLKAKPSK